MSSQTRQAGSARTATAPKASAQADSARTHPAGLRETMPSFGD
ncbi:hypothetical protein ACFC7A_31595 [Streptomyces niveus]